MAANSKCIRGPSEALGDEKKALDSEDFEIDGEDNGFETVEKGFEGDGCTGDDSSEEDIMSESFASLRNSRLRLQVMLIIVVQGLAMRPRLHQSLRNMRREERSFNFVKGLGTLRGGSSLFTIHCDCQYLSFYCHKCY